MKNKEKWLELKKKKTFVCSKNNILELNEKQQQKCLEFSF